MRKEAKTAIWVAIAGFAWVLLEFVTGLHTSNIDMHATVTWFAFVPTILIYIIHFEYLKKQMQDQLTFKKGFLSGTLVTFIAIPLSQIGFAIFYYLINPSLFSAFKNYSVQNQIMSADEADLYFNIGNYLVQIALGILIIGLLLSSILSFIYKSKTK